MSSASITRRVRSRAPELGAVVFIAAGAVSPWPIVSALALAAGIALGGLALYRVRASEQRLRTLFTPMTDVVMMLDRDGRYLDVAPTDPVFLIAPPSDLVGKKLSDVLPPDKAATLLEQIGLALATRRSVQFDYDLELNGKVVPFSAAIVPVPGDKVVWVARDITARREEDRAIHDGYARLEERYRSIVEHVSDIIFTLSLDGRILSVNSALERVLGYAPAEWIARSFVDFVVPEEVEQSTSLFNRALVEDKLPLASATVLAKDGSRVVIEVALTRQTANGTTVGFYGVGRDVTASRMAVDRLRQSEERFRLVARATNDAVYDWHVASGEVWWSDAYYGLFGYAPDSCADFDAWKERIHPDDRQRVLDSMQTAMDAGQDVWNGEYRYRKADGSYASVLDRAYILRNDRIEVVRLTGAMTDMTERKQLEEQLAHARRMSSLGRVAASVAHEFNNVLMGIQPNVELLRRRTTAENRTTLDHIVQSVQRGKYVTDEILSFTRPSEPTLRCVNVSGFLDAWQAEIRPVLGTSIGLQFNVTDPDLFMLADGLQLAQVMTILALNARDAMPGHGHITVTAALGRSFSSFGFGAVKTPDGYVHFAVSDDGTGMTPEQMGHLFEPLFTTKRGGTGLGLAISYQLVARLGGHIFVESEVGKGTTFHLMVPATHPVLNEGGQQRIVELPVRSVLIVEDEPAVAMGLQTLLELEGIAVTTVGTGAEVVPAIERVRPGAVVLDVGLPDCDGSEVYTAIAERWPDLPVLFSSGHADAAKLNSYLSRSNVGMLLKPYDFEAFRQALLRIVTQGSVLRAQGSVDASAGRVGF